MTTSRGFFVGESAVDRILLCKALPTLPGVALEVLELARDRGTPMEKIADVVQNDPGLAAKVLKTVNSSYYGLRKPCPTIHRAVGLLGLNTVKSLVLGFSLVDTANRIAGKGFDLVAYWRRAVYGAAGARLIGKMIKGCDPEEAFVGALLQDMGMLAAHAAMGEQYARVLAGAPPDHSALPALETAALGFNHATVGARLAEKWRLPPQIVECILKHHTPDLAARPHEVLVRLVSLAGESAAALTLSAAQERLGVFVRRASEWFGIRREEALALMRGIGDGAGQLSSILELKTGQAPNIAAILADANEQLVLHQLEVETESSALQSRNEELSRETLTDQLTGTGSRRQFDQQMAHSFEDASAGGSRLAVVFVDADRFKAINDAHGHAAGDAVLVELAARLQATVGPAGTVCRYGGEEFGVILPGMGAKAAARIAEQARGAIDARPFDLAGAGLKVQGLRCTVSAGVAALESGVRYGSPDELVRAADEACYAAKLAGRNCVRTAEPGSAPVRRGRAVSILLVEDDALAAKLLELMFSKRADARLSTVRTGEEALRLAEGNGEPPDVVLVDLHLHGMSGADLVRRICRVSRWRGAYIAVLSNSEREEDKRSAIGAGARVFVSKVALCSNFPKWIAEVVEVWGAAKGQRKAA